MGTGAGGTELCICRALGFRRGELKLGGGSSMLQLSAGKTRRAGRPGTAGTKAAGAGCSHGKTHRGAGAGAARLAAAAAAAASSRPFGRAGPLPAGTTTSKGRSRERENAGRVTSPRSRHAPGACKHCGLAVVHPPGACEVLHTAPWRVDQSAAAGRVAATTWGARTEPTLARTRTLRCAHDDFHARAPRHASCPQLPGQKEGNSRAGRGGNEIEAR